MKKLIFTTLILWSTQLFAQIPSGTILVGGSGYFSNTKPKGATSASKSSLISPQIGYFFADNFAAGAKMNFSDNSLSSLMEITPFLRYYFMGKTFFEPSFAFGTNKYGGIKQSGYTAEADLGYALFLNSHVAIEPALYANFSKYGSYSATGFGLKFGFQIYLNKD